MVSITILVSVAIFSLSHGAPVVQVPEYLEVSSSWGAATAQSSKMGIYKLQDQYHNNFPVWKKDGENKYLFVSDKKTWGIRPNLNSTASWLYNSKKNPTPVLPTTDGWEYAADGWFNTDYTLRIKAVAISCECSVFLNPDGYAMQQCNKRDSAFGGAFMCYINLPSACSDRLESKSMQGKWKSAEPCEINSAHKFSKYLKVSSTGEAAASQDGKMGIYELTDEELHNFPSWKKETAEEYLFVDEAGYWSFGNPHGGNSNAADIYSPEKNPTPISPLFADQWLYSAGDAGMQIDNAFNIQAFMKPITSDDVDGALGDGREFNDGEHLAILWNQTNEIQSSQCCEECKKVHPDTEMFNFRLSTSTVNTCYCMKRKLQEHRPATHAFRIFSGTCPNYAGQLVRGALGEGRTIQYGDSHGLLQKWDDVEKKVKPLVDENECCDLCNDPDRSWLPDPMIKGSLYEYIEEGWGVGCQCYTTMELGWSVAPETSAYQRSAGICK